MAISKILSAQQTQTLDQETIRQEPISSIDLMERASRTFFHAFQREFGTTDREICLICGPGNNGGDGLAIARMLHEAAYEVVVWRVVIGQPSADHQINYDRLLAKRVISVMDLSETSDLPIPEEGSILIDGLFGSGLNRPIGGVWGHWIDRLNEAKITRVAIDVPSGLMADQPSSGNIVQADLTLTFQLPKLAFFAPENARYIGRWEVLDIGLSETALEQIDSPNYYVPLHATPSMLQQRGRFDHKGTFGHCLIIAGSHGKIGAAILSAKAALRSGCGLVSVQVPGCGYAILQIAFPEAMVIVDPHQEIFTTAPVLDSFQAVGIGPGLGTNWLTRKALQELLTTTDLPLVLDADALNILGMQKDWQADIPKDSILTPHPKEFERLFGPTSESFSRWELLREQARRLSSYILLKGGNTVIASPDGELYFLNVGNPGMATAGAGDVLTGIISGLLAQGYTSHTATILGAVLHGLAGDIAADQQQMESLIAEDIIKNLGAAFGNLRSQT